MSDPVLEAKFFRASLPAFKSVSEWEETLFALGREVWLEVRRAQLAKWMRELDPDNEEEVELIRKAKAVMHRCEELLAHQREVN